MSQTIFWGNIYCGNVGTPTTPPLHCTFGHALYRVTNPPVQDQWEHVCQQCEHEWGSLVSSSRGSTFPRN